MSPSPTSYQYTNQILTQMFSHRMIIVSAFFLNIGHPGIVKELGAVKASGAEDKVDA